MFAHLSRPENCKQKNIVPTTSYCVVFRQTNRVPNIHLHVNVNMSFSLLHSFHGAWSWVLCLPPSSHRHFFPFWNFYVKFFSTLIVLTIWRSQSKKTLFVQRRFHNFYIQTREENEVETYFLVIFNSSIFFAFSTKQIQHGLHKS